MHLSKNREMHFLYLIGCLFDGPEWKDVYIVAYYLRHIEKGDRKYLRILDPIDYLLSVENTVWIKR